MLLIYKVPAAFYKANFKKPILNVSGIHLIYKAQYTFLNIKII